MIFENTVYNLGNPASTTAAAIGCPVSDGCQVIGNVIHDIGANVTSCGGTAGIAFYGTNGLAKFNEVYRVQPTTFTAGCDWIGIDIDLGASNIVVEYNYTHDNYGPGFEFFCKDNGSYLWNNNTFRYNISENDGGDHVGDATNGMVAISGYAGCPTGSTANFYGNVIWSNVPGTGSAAPAGIAFAGIAAGAGPTYGLWANNIIAVTPAGGNCNFISEANSAGISPTLIFANNDYFCIGGGTPRWYQINGLHNYTSLAAWQAVAPAGDLGSTTANPTLSGTGGTGGTCNNALPNPAAPACPTAYELQGSSALLGAGFYLIPPFDGTGTTAGTPTVDYFGTTLPPSANHFYSIGAFQGAPTSTESTSPTVSVTSPGAGTVSGNVTLTATCSDSVRCEGVQFQINGSKFALPVGPGTSVTWPTLYIPNASYTITAIAYNTVGHSTTSAGVVVTTINNAPQ